MTEKGKDLINSKGVRVLLSNYGSGYTPYVAKAGEDLGRVVLGPGLMCIAEDEALMWRTLSQSLSNMIPVTHLQDESCDMRNASQARPQKASTFAPLVPTKLTAPPRRLVARRPVRAASSTSSAPSLQPATIFGEPFSSEPALYSL